MNCPKCNSLLSEGAAFCASCGLNIAQGSTAQPAPGHSQQAQQPQQPQGFAPPPGPPPQGYPPPYPPPGGFAPQGFAPQGFVPQTPPRTSGMAIAGFVLSFFCSLLGLIFSIIGYNECKNSNGTVTGGGLALAGIIISIVSMLIGLMVVASGSHL